MNRRFIRIFIAIGIVAALVVYFTFDPATPGGWFPKCPFTTLTGWKCPGCGSQRALHQLLHGDIVQAWHYNAGLVVGLPLAATFFVAEKKRTEWHKFYMAVNHPAVLLTLFVAIVLWWIGRNVAGL